MEFNSHANHPRTHAWQNIQRPCSSCPMGNCQKSCSVRDKLWLNNHHNLNHTPPPRHARPVPRPDREGDPSHNKVTGEDKWQARDSKGDNAHKQSPPLPVYLVHALAWPSLRQAPPTTKWVAEEPWWIIFILKPLHSMDTKMLAANPVDPTVILSIPGKHSFKLND